MKPTREEKHEMQEYLKDRLELLSLNHTFPKEEKILTRMLVIITETETSD